MFQAKNADGAKVYIKYAGNNLMEISAYAAKDSSDSTSSSTTSKSEAKNETPATQNSSSSASTSDGVTAEFKEMMDGYESIMNKYCDFMEKYSSSSNTTSMLADYAKITAEYTEWSGKVAAVDQSSLSEADLAYYLEVMNRVNQRLAEVAA